VNWTRTGYRSAKEKPRYARMVDTAGFRVHTCMTVAERMISATTELTVWPLLSAYARSASA
jgi:hypothetical protein